MSNSSAATWLTARDVQAQLKISRSAAFALIRKLPRLKVGKILRVRAADLEAFLTTNMLPGKPGPTALQAGRARARADAELALLLRSAATNRKQTKAGAALLSHAKKTAELAKPTRPRVRAPEPALPPIRHTRQPAKLPY